MELLEQAAVSVRQLKRHELFDNKKSKTNEKDITTYNPNVQAFREVVQTNWDMLGKSPA